MSLSFFRLTDKFDLWAWLNITEVQWTLRNSKRGCTFYGDLTGDFRDSLGTSLEADTHFVMATAMS